MLKGAGDYRVFDRILRSEMELPSLDRAPSPGPATLHFTLCEKSHRQGELIHEWRTGEGELTLSASRLPDGGYDLYLPGGGHFYIDHDLKRVACAPNETADEATIEHLLLDQVVPRVLAQAGQVVLHGSAVLLETGQVIGFVGDTGAGKSTLAAAFVDSGARLLTDDSFAVDIQAGEPFIVPGYGSLRLWDDSAGHYLAGHAGRPMAHYSSKQRLALAPAQRANGPLGLQALFVLQDNGKAGIVLEGYTSAAEATMTLMKAIFALDIRDPVCHRQWLGAIEALVSGVGVNRLSFPRTYQSMPDVISTVRGSV